MIQFNILSINPSHDILPCLSISFVINLDLLLLDKTPDFASVKDFLGNCGLLISFFFLFNKPLISSILSKY